MISWLLEFTDYHIELCTAPARISLNYCSFPYNPKTYSLNSPRTLRIYFIIQILPFLPSGLEDQLPLDHLWDLFCLLHLVGLLVPGYHVAPIKNKRAVIRKIHSTRYSQKIHLRKPVINFKLY